MQDERRALTFLARIDAVPQWRFNGYGCINELEMEHSSPECDPIGPSQFPLVWNDYIWGLVYAHRHQNADAEESLQRYVAHAGRATSATLVLANVERQLGRDQLAEKFLAQYRAAYPGIDVSEK